MQGNARLRKALARASAGFAVPMHDGSLEEFEFFRTWVLSEQGKDAYLNLRTYVGKGIDDPYA